MVGRSATRDRTPCRNRSSNTRTCAPCAETRYSHPLARCPHYHQPLPRSANRRRTVQIICKFVTYRFTDFSKESRFAGCTALERCNRTNSGSRSNPDSGRSSRIPNRPAYLVSQRAQLVRTVCSQARNAGDSTSARPLTHGRKNRTHTRTFRPGHVARL